MKNVRIWFEKNAECRFISHLDLNRVMLRAVHKSRLPVWHTEGFNPHPFVTFALPLSLGVRGKCETMDFRLLDENYPLDEIPAKLNACLPDGIRVYSAAEPVMKAGEIAFARYKILLDSAEKSPDEIYSAMEKLLSRDEIVVEKKTKSGVKDVDIKPKLGEYTLETAENAVVFRVVLPAGSSENINPALYINALEKYYGIKPCADMTREVVYNAEMKEFA